MKQRKMRLERREDSSNDEEDSIDAEERDDED